MERSNLLEVFRKALDSEFAKQYDKTSSELEKKNQPNGFTVVVRELDWAPVLINAGISGASTAFATYVVTRPQYANLVRKVKQRLNVTNNQFSRELNDYISSRLVRRADNLTAFVNKNLTQKLDDISNAWKAVYPEIFVERSLFEDIMGYYRYPKSSGWGHTGDIAHNFKAIDFYDGFTTVGDKIYSSRAISMKTTTTTNVDSWLASNPVRNNIVNLQDNLGATKGITWNGKTIYYTKAEVHIYMPKENVTQALKTEWLNKLSTEVPNIKFEINALEDFVK